MEKKEKKAKLEKKKETNFGKKRNKKKRGKVGKKKEKALWITVVIHSKLGVGEQ
jgi:hypothetical protein